MHSDSHKTIVTLALYAEQAQPIRHLCTCLSEFPLPWD